MKASRLLELPTVPGHPHLRPLGRPNRRPGRFLAWCASLALLGLTLAWAVNAYRQQAITMAQLTREAASLDANVQQARERRDALSREVRNLQTDDYVEMLARQRGYVKPGETTFTTKSDEH